MHWFGCRTWLPKVVNDPHLRQAETEFWVDMDSNGSGAPSTRRGANGPHSPGSNGKNAIELADGAVNVDAH